MLTASLRLYVACLASYNSGILHGAWINAADDLNSIKQQITVMLAASPSPDAEEYAFHDYEGFGCLVLSENEDLETLHSLATAIQEHGEAFSLYADLAGLDATVEGFQDEYLGAHESEEDFARDWWEQAGYLAQIPDSLRCYIDWERVARDFFMDGFSSTKDSQHTIHVFAR